MRPHHIAVEISDRLPLCLCITSTQRLKMLSNNDDEIQGVTVQPLRLRAHRKSPCMASGAAPRFEKNCTGRVAHLNFGFKCPVNAHVVCGFSCTD